MRSQRSYLLFPLLSSITAAADPIAIPNFSFEEPTVRRGKDNPLGALPNIADWDERDVGVTLFDEAHVDTGVFVNPPSGEPDRISNMHLMQAAFVSSLMGNTVRQELPEPFLPGNRYTFTVAVGTSYTYPVGATEQLQVALFYYVGNTEQIIASTFVAGAEVNPNLVLDFSVTSPVVEESNPWAHEPIGILVRPFITDPDDEDGEGFWNVDYARLNEILPPDPDSDEDGDVDLADFAAFQKCFSETEAVSGACGTLDLNSDSVVDLQDLWMFAQAISGPV